MLNKYLGDRVFWGDALRLALPIALQNLLLSSFSLVDTVMISSLGDISLAAVGMAGQLTWMMGLVMFGFCSGTSVFIAQYWGVRDVKGIHRVYGILLVNMAVVSAVFLAAGFFIPGEIVRVFNGDPAVVAEGAAYLKIACFSYPAIALSNTFSAVLRSTERVRLPMYASLASTIVNIIFNYGLIYGKLGMPRLGVRGAAIATCVAAYVSPLLIFIVSYIEKNIIIAEKKEIFAFRADALKRFYRISTPVVLNESLWGLGTVLYNVIFGRLGYENYAAITIYRTIDALAFTFFIGLCTACGVMVGKAVGSGDIDEGYGTAVRFSVVVPLLSFAVGLLAVLTRGGLVGLFNETGTLSEYTRTAASSILLIYGFEYVLRNIPYILIVGVFRSGGDTKIGMKYDMICLWGIALPLTALTAFVIRLPFVWVFALMLFGEDGIKVVLCVRRFLSKKWIKPLTAKGASALKETGAAREEI